MNEVNGIPERVLARVPELDVEYFREKLKSETNELVKERISKQIELLEDAIVIYHEQRLPEGNENGKS